jgi:hypothetical protein
MGRPPIGKVAMTATERSRRYRAGLAAPTATKLEPDHRDEEIARLRAQVAELQHQTDVLPRGIEPDGRSAAR